MKLLWFLYDQNNSGGKFIRNDRVGDYLFIQAYDVAEADRIMDSATAQDNWWCGCCGLRWSPCGELPELHPNEFNLYGVPERNEVAILYYYDGTVKKCSDTVTDRRYFYDVDD